MKILILGGTREAAELASKLVTEGHHVTTSLAGRTKEPKPVAGNVRIGGFGGIGGIGGVGGIGGIGGIGGVDGTGGVSGSAGIDGLAKYLIEFKIELLIDCTHPFAKQISANAVAAAKRAGVKLEIRTRQPWQKQTGDQWIEVSNLEAMRDCIPSGARVLLALGSQYIDLFKTCDDGFFLVRMVDAPEEPLGLPNHQLLLGKPSSDWHEEAELLKTHSITHIACRNSGGKGAYAKIKAARALGIPVIILAQ